MTTAFSFEGAVRLSHLAVIRARGADALKFLQGQLTNDVAALAPGRTRLAGFCSAKGRLQASFMVWRSGPENLLLACAASVLPATLKRLSMFVMRAQCKLDDASAELPLWGVAGDAARRCALGLGVGELRDANGMSVLRLPDVAGSVRCLLVGHDAAPPMGLAVATSEALATWRLGEVSSGIPLIEAATVDQFVPQMLNYEIVGGVDFQKGCYPGQEIVARSQYRGTIKRRMFLFEVDAAALPGQEVFHSADAGQPAGMVVNAATTALGSTTALVEVKLAALDSGSLHLGSADGAVLRRTALPYDVPTDAIASTPCGSSSSTTACCPSRPRPPVSRCGRCRRGWSSNTRRFDHACCVATHPPALPRPGWKPTRPTRSVRRPV